MKMPLLVRHHLLPLIIIIVANLFVGTNAGGTHMNADKCLACVEKGCGYCHKTSPKESSHYASGLCVCSFMDYKHGSQCNDHVYATDDYYNQPNYYNNYQQYENRGQYYNGAVNNRFDWIVTKANTKIGCHVQGKSESYKVVRGLSIAILSAIGLFFGMAFVGFFINHCKRRRSAWKARKKAALLSVGEKDVEEDEQNVLDTNGVL